ncbi:MAG TPA: hypothetical protein VGQ83_20250 [Polyangia bacterium]|jgi:lysophospholipase L1-like esterase
MRRRGRLAIAAAGLALVALGACGPPRAGVAPPPPARLRVLFLGNSLTVVNDLPGWVRRLAAAAPGGPAVETALVAAGGATLSDHWRARAPREAITRGGWTHVVIQAPSLEPLRDPEGFRAAAAHLAQAARAAGAVPVLLAAWTPEPGHAAYAEAWSGGSPAAMLEQIRAAHAAAARASGALLAPVGDAWAAVRARQPAVRLTAADGAHPSPAGTYAAACVIYERLAGRPAPAAPVPEGLSAADAAMVRAAASAAGR